MEGVWTRYEAENGVPYFYNEQTGETTWDDPNQALVEQAFFAGDDQESAAQEGSSTQPEVEGGGELVERAEGDEAGEAREAVKAAAAAAADGEAVEGAEDEEEEDFDSEKRKEKELQAEMDAWPQTYEELATYGDEQEAGTRGLQKLKRCMPKVIFDRSQLHGKDEGAPVLQELEKLSLAHNCVAAAKELKRADRMVKEAAELRRK